MNRGWKSILRWRTAQAVILSQVTFGIAVRMAVMSIVAGNSGSDA
jgi:aspartate carbamoyltransferase catalytic subunit